MRLHEFQGKALFRQYGIPVPAGKVVDQGAAARAIAAELGGKAAVKAQVLVGGRGHAGGILMAATPREAGHHTEMLLNTRIKGCKTESVLVEEQLHICREFYLGIAVDRAVGQPVLLLGAAGGIDIEHIAREKPETLATLHVDPRSSLETGQVHELIGRAGLGGCATSEIADILMQLYHLFGAYEALIAEINPLVLRADGGLVAADAVVEVDDNAVGRHPELESFSGGEERRAGGLTFVGLEGEIGLICSGAGLGMATIDLIAEAGARPANFLETGGGITHELMAQAMRQVLEQPGLEGILINIYGGINPIHEGAGGIAEVMAEGVEVPVVAKALGHRQEETWAILEAAGATVVRATATERAVEEVLRQAALAQGAAS